ncbi:MAG: DUF881 domain-containing protein [Actinomycetes bacterium]
MTQTHAPEDAAGEVAPPRHHAPRQHAQRPGRPRVPLAVTAVLVVAGLLFSASANASGGSNLRDDVADLPSLIEQEAGAVAASAERVAALRAEVERLTGVVGGQEVQSLQDAADVLATPGGLSAVEGPGVEITLDDAPRDRPVPEGTSADLLIVHQEDLQAVVNALWAGGAEAMMLMDQRVISTSAVRCVGNTLRLQGRVYSPPYTVKAIGDTGELLAALDRSPEVSIYREYVRAYGLGYDEQLRRSIEMPAFQGSLEMRYAEVLRGDAA